MGDQIVVVAEDDPGLRELLTHTLETEGYTVEAFGAGDDCWERLETDNRPDLLLLDVMMPGLDGAAVLERVRADDRLADLTVVFISGRARDSDIVTDSAAPDDYVTKPFSPSELRTRISQLLE